MPRVDICKYGVATRFKPQGEIPSGIKLAKKPLAVKVTEEADNAIRALPEQAAWLRRVICEAAQRELLGQSQGNNDKADPTASDRSPCLTVPKKRRTRLQKQS